jgi:hypothetical protein
MPIKLSRFVLRVTIDMHIQIDAADGKSAQKLVNRAFADGGNALDQAAVRIKPLRGESFGPAHIIKVRVTKPAALVKGVP